MSATANARLFEPIRVGNLSLRNRLFSSAYETGLNQNHRVTDPMVAYYEARARGGVGLIITQSIGIHDESGFYDHRFLLAEDDQYIEGLKRLADVCHEHDCRLFGQLMHIGNYGHASADGGPGRPIGPSSGPTELYHSWSDEMSVELIEEIIEAYASAAKRLQMAGFDGTEITCGHRYLPNQFLNPNSNKRNDQYGGSFENRIRFLREVLRGVRAAVGEDFVIGIRTGEEMDHDGLSSDDIVEACAALDADGLADYYNICAGSESTPRGGMFYVAPMNVEQGYTASQAEKVRNAVDRPVFVVGRINDPQTAERIISQGQADMCGMARALICDPEMPRKAEAGRTDEIRICIGCNQSCIGNYSAGASVSCIQYPESGRELVYGVYGKAKPAAEAKRVLVVGGGPAGMKAAATAANRGHSVTLIEREAQLGGQVLLAQLLPGRGEFGGLAQNLSREMTEAGVDVRIKTQATKALIEAETPDVIILATGGAPRIPEIEGAEEAHVVTAEQVLAGEVEVGPRVLVADGRADWVGPGVAQLLAMAGHSVRLAALATQTAAALELATQLHAVGQLFSQGVEVIPNARLYGADSDTVYLQHTITNEPIVCERVDSVVIAHRHEPARELKNALSGTTAEVIMIGDCLAPRTAKEAVLEGLEVASSL